MDIYGTKVGALVANAFMVVAWVVLTLTASGDIGEFYMKNSLQRSAEHPGVRR